MDSRRLLPSDLGLVNYLRISVVTRPYTRRGSWKRHCIVSMTLDIRASNNTSLSAAVPQTVP